MSGKRKYLEADSNLAVNSKTSASRNSGRLTDKQLKQRTIDLLFQGQARLAQPTASTSEPSTEPRVFARGKKGLPALGTLYQCPSCAYRTTTAVVWTQCRHCDRTLCPECVHACAACRDQFCKDCSVV
ncbi:hypothetical protein H4R35_005020, partial [Dimargaris xerosporica]